MSGNCRTYRLRKKTEETGKYDHVERRQIQSGDSGVAPATGKLEKEPEPVLKPVSTSARERAGTASRALREERGLAAKYL